MSAVTAVRMPKWGLSMQEGTIVDWWKAEGDAVAEGEDLVDTEPSKITNVGESPAAGVLRRIVAQPGETLPVGALIGVLADAEVPDAELDSFIADFQANFPPAEADAEGEGPLAISTGDAAGHVIRAGRAGPAEGGAQGRIHGFAGGLNNCLLHHAALAGR